MEQKEPLERVKDRADDRSDDEQKTKQNLETRIGITMAILGVLLAFCAEKVGLEDAALIQGLVDQANAQAQYHAQDVKHRVAVLALQQVHAIAFGSAPNTLNKSDVLAMAQTVDRYYQESQLANQWSASFDPEVETYVHAQDSYEGAQLCAEIAVVLASIGLLVQRRDIWFVAIAVGLISVTIVGNTYVHTTKAERDAENHTTEAGKQYAEARTRDRTRSEEQELLASIRAWARVTPGAVESTHTSEAPRSDAR